MRVVFLENVPSVAKAGDVKEVKDGFGRNYLIPRKLAKAATAAVMKDIERQHEVLDRRAAKLEADADNLTKQLDGLAVTITAKIGNTGRLYGSVTNADVAAELQKKLGKPVDRRKIMLHDPIRALGTYPVEVHLGAAHTATVQVTVAGQEV